MNDPIPNSPTSLLEYFSFTLFFIAFIWGYYQIRPRIDQQNKHQEKYEARKEKMRRKNAWEKRLKHKMEAEARMAYIQRRFGSPRWFKEDDPTTGGDPFKLEKKND